MGHNNSHTSTTSPGRPHTVVQNSHAKPSYGTFNRRSCMYVYCRTARQYPCRLHAACWAAHKPPFSQRTYPHWRAYKPCRMGGLSVHHNSQPVLLVQAQYNTPTALNNHMPIKHNQGNNWPWCRSSRVVRFTWQHHCMRLAKAGLLSPILQSCQGGLLIHPIHSFKHTRLNTCPSLKPMPLNSSSSSHCWYTRQ